MKYENGLFIFRRDLRLEDNKALINAHKKCNNVHTIFVFTPEQIGNTNDFKSNNAILFMLQSLKELETKISQKKGKLSLYYGKNSDVLREIFEKNDINCVFFNEDITPYARNRDSEIYDLCKRENIQYEVSQDYYLLHPLHFSEKTEKGEIYYKFNSFYEKTMKAKIEPVSQLSTFKFEFLNGKSKYDTSLQKITSKYTKPNLQLNVEGGRINGKKILQRAVKNLKNYGKTRDYLYIETSLLSAPIKFGCVSIREVYYHFVKAFGKNSEIVRQLMWREFYMLVLFHNPQVYKKSLNEKYDKIKWSSSNANFEAWKQGKTGYPVVDACMRQLNTTGYMHNRGRLITASFLVKILHINWRKGEKYFAQQLVDYDPASNNGNWQWISGSGANNQPYFRVFNPWIQSDQYDKQAIFIKKWVHELKNVEPKHIHKWHEYYKDYNVYMKPIVDYDVEKEKSLELYKKIF